MKSLGSKFKKGFLELSKKGRMFSCSYGPSTAPGHMAYRHRWECNGVHVTMEQFKHVVISLHRNAIK